MLLYLILSLSAVVCAAKSCYFPDGPKALGHYPCSDEPTAPCCANDHICMANGLCVNVGSHQPYGFSRAACTDKGWGGDCPQICVGPSDHRSGGCAVVPFILDGMNTEYCCSSVVSNGSIATCESGESSFKLDNGQAVPGRAYLSTLGNKDNNDNKNVAIGAGVGVPLGVLLLTALGWALYERKKRYSLLNSAVGGVYSPVQPGAGQPGVEQPAGGQPVREAISPVPVQELMGEQKKPRELEAHTP